MATGVAELARAVVPEQCCISPEGTRLVVGDLHDVLKDVKYGVQKHPIDLVVTQSVVQAQYEHECWESTDA